MRWTTSPRKHAEPTTDHLMGDWPAAIRQVRIGCAFTYLAEVNTPTVFQVRPSDSRGVRVLSEKWFIQPEFAARHYRDLFGNPCLRVVLPAGRSSLRYDALARVPDAVEDVDEDAPETPPDQLPDDVLHYTLPSRYSLPDMLGDEAWSRFGSTPPGYRRVRAICAHVHQHPQFRYGSSTALAAATDANTSGRASAATSPTWRSHSAARSTSRPATSSATFPNWTGNPIQRRWTSPHGWRSGSPTAGGHSTPRNTPAARGA